MPLWDVMFLDPEIFDTLSRIPVGHGNELQLTDAINELNKQQAVLAYNFEGNRYDIGDKIGLIKATMDFALLSTARRTSSSAGRPGGGRAALRSSSAPSAPRLRRRGRPAAPALVLPTACRPASTHHRPRGQRVRPERDHDRLAEVEIGHAGGEDLHRRGAGELELDVRQRRRLDLAEERVHLLLHLGRAADVGEGAASQPRRLAHEVAVRRRADADREQAAVAETLPDGVEQLLFVADLPVGQEHDLPQAAGAARAVERQVHRRQHLGPAVGAQRADIALRAGEIARSAGMRGGEDAVGDRVELDDVERVVGLQTRERQRQRRLRLRDRGSGHRARGVDHEDRLARHATPGRRRRAASSSAARRPRRRVASVSMAAVGVAPATGAHMSSKSRLAGTAPSRQRDRVTVAAQVRVWIG